jgi:hypothetical protein
MQGADPAVEFARARRRAVRIRLTIVFALLLAPVGYMVYRFAAGQREASQHEEQARIDSLATPEQIAEAKELLPELARRIDASGSAIREDLTADAVEAALASSAGPCRYDVVREFGISGLGDVGRAQLVWDHKMPLPVVATLPLAIDVLESPRGELTTIPAHIAADQLTKTEVAELRQDAHDLGGALILIGRASQAVTVGGSYVPGVIDGDVVLYLYRTRRIACAGHITARTPESVMVEYRALGPSQEAADRAADDKLATALYDAFVQALRTDLQAVGR